MAAKYSADNKNPRRKPLLSAGMVASLRGVEPPAYRLGGGRSIQLSYSDIYTYKYPFHIAGGDMKRPLLSYNRTGGLVKQLQNHLAIKKEVVYNTILYKKANAIAWECYIEVV